MPLFDHFNLPLSTRRSWNSFRVTWAHKLADALNGTMLPKGYFAQERVFPVPRHLAPPEGALAECQSWDPPPPALVMPAFFPIRSEVLVCSDGGDPDPLAAVIIVSPAHKSCVGERRALAARCASYLGQGTHLILVDVVTQPRGNLHNEIMRILQVDEEFRLPADMSLYAVAYRSVMSEEKAEIQLWPAILTVGRALPVLPLEVTEELVVPIDLETTYIDACRALRMI